MAHVYRQGARRAEGVALLTVSPQRLVVIARASPNPRSIARSKVGPGAAPMTLIIMMSAGRRARTIGFSVERHQSDHRPVAFDDAGKRSLRTCPTAFAKAANARTTRWGSSRRRWSQTVCNAASRSPMAIASNRMWWCQAVGSTMQGAVIRYNAL